MHKEKLLKEATALLRSLPDRERFPRHQRSLQSIHRRLAKMLSKLGQGITLSTTHSVNGMTDAEIEELALNLLDNQCGAMYDALRTYIAEPR